MEKDGKFIVVQNTNLTEFQKSINDYLDKGYRLHGEMKITTNPNFKLYGDGLIYIQPVLKEKSDAN